MAATHRGPVIVVLGPAGSGKTTFIRHLVGDASIRNSISIHHGLENRNSEVQFYNAKIGGKDVTLVDTPGLEPGLEDTVVQKVVDWKRNERIRFVDGIVLLFPMLQGRLPETMRSGLLQPKLEKIFGHKSPDDRYRHLALVATRWTDHGWGTGVFDYEVVKTREDELRDEFGWGLCERMGAFFRHFDNTEECAMKIVSMVLQNRGPVIIVLGPPGSGKSTFIQHLVGDGVRIPIHHGLENRNSEVQSYNAKIGGKDVTLVDTPGLEPGLEDTVVQKVVDWKRNERIRFVDGIVLLFPMLQGRLPETMRSGLLQPKLEKIFGHKPPNDRYRHLALVTTRWTDHGQGFGVFDYEVVKMREDELRDGYGWGFCERMGAFFRHFDNTEECAMKIVSMVLQNRGPVIIVLGPPGSGKTTFIQHLVGDGVRIPIHHGLENRNSEVQAYNAKIGEKEVTLVDTPGLEPGLEDTVVQKVVDWKVKERIKFIDGIVLLFPMLEGRLSKSMRSGLLLPKLDKMFGHKPPDDRYRHLALVATRWTDHGSGTGGFNYKVVKERKDELRDGYGWRLCEAMGAFFRHHDNTEECAMDIVSMVLQNPPIILVLGPSGAGRSSFIKRLLDDVEIISVEDRLTPVTTHVQPYGISLEEKRLFLVDTPGIDDPGQTFDHIEDWMKKRKPRLETIDGIIFFLPVDISQGGIGNYMHRNLVKPALAKFLDVSRNRYAGLVFVTSLRSDELVPRYPWSEEEVRDALGTLEGLGAKLMRYDNTLESAKGILGELVPGPVSMMAE